MSRLGKYFSEFDRDVVEWTIGAVLTGGPRTILIFRGGPASGKSTMLSLIEKIWNENRTHSSSVIDIHHDAMARLTGERLNTIRTHPKYKIDPVVSVKHDESLFLASLEDLPGITGKGFTVTAIGSTMAFKRYNEIMSAISNDTRSIADLCITKYRDLGADYFDLNKELSK